MSLLYFLLDPGAWELLPACGYGQKNKSKNKKKKTQLNKRKLNFLVFKKDSLAIYEKSKNMLNINRIFKEFSWVT